MALDIISGGKKMDMATAGLTVDSSIHKHCPLYTLMHLAHAAQIVGVSAGHEIGIVPPVGLHQRCVLHKSLCQADFLATDRWEALVYSVSRLAG